jgi:hypothetical protein
MKALEEFYGEYVPLDDVRYIRFVEDDDDCLGGYLECHVRRKTGIEVIRFKGAYG